MADLIYASNMSVDGFTEDEHGGLDWAPPDDEVQLYVWPIVLAGCNPSLQPAGGSAQLSLIDEHRFTGGAVRLRYRVQ